MLKKYLATAMLGSTLLAPLAFAETPAAPGTNAAQVNSTNMNASTQGEWRASKVVGLNVYNSKDENVGSINDLLTDKSGAIKTVVIGVGGFLGMGEKNVAESAWLADDDEVPRLLVHCTRREASRLEHPSDHVLGDWAILIASNREERTNGIENFHW
jgi:sporulation protein YlmC with PRC-barrel domain